MHHTCGKLRRRAAPSDGGGNPDHQRDRAGGEHLLLDDEGISLAAGAADTTDEKTAELVGEGIGARVPDVAAVATTQKAMMAVVRTPMPPEMSRRPA
jgi:hypothetical protein